MPLIWSTRVIDCNMQAIYTAITEKFGIFTIPYNAYNKDMEWA